MPHPPQLELQKRAVFGPCTPAVGSLLLLASLLAVLSLVLRAYYSGRETYFFLFKDLFLAWVPMALSSAIVRLARRDSRGVGRFIVLVVFSLTWVLFLPNAPYLLTEILHLNAHHAPRNMRPIPISLLAHSPRRDHIPIWYDAFMVLLFAWNGLLLGVLSLRMVQDVARERVGAAWGWAGAAALVVLCGFGVTLGRFERFNSWDIFALPATLAPEIASRMLRPSAHPRTTGATLMLSAFLLLAYVTMVAMMNGRKAIRACGTLSTVAKK